MAYFFFFSEVISRSIERWEEGRIGTDIVVSDAGGVFLLGVMPVFLELMVMAAYLRIYQTPWIVYRLCCLDLRELHFSKVVFNSAEALISM